MKITNVKANNKKKGFEICTHKSNYSLPYTKCNPCPTHQDPIESVYIDPEIGCEGITYILKSGKEGTIHLDSFLFYNKDPSYMRDMLLYELTVEAQHKIAKSKISKREIMRRLGTSAAQFYRLLDQTNYTKTVDQILRLLSVLDCEVRLVVQERIA